MKINKIYIAAVFILVAAFFAAGREGPQVTGQLVKVEYTDTKLPNYLEVTQGQRFIVPSGANAYDLARFNQYDASGRTITITTASGTKQFTTFPSTIPFLGQQMAYTVWAGKTITVVVNDGKYYPDKLPRMYVLSYINQDRTVNVGEIFALSGTDMCQAISCPPIIKYQPVLWELINIDPSQAQIDFNDLFWGGSKSFTYDSRTGRVDLVVFGQTYQAQVIQTAPNTYALSLTDQQFNILDTSTIGVAYYR